MIIGYNCDFFVYCGKTESGEKCTESCAVLKQDTSSEQKLQIFLW